MNISNLDVMYTVYYVIFFGLWVIFLIYFFKDIKKEPFAKTIWPNLMTGLGALGTFFGILLSLIHFNTTSIEDSLPMLLKDLKFVFVTSVVGLVTSIFLQIRENIIIKSSTKKENEDKIINDLIQNLAKQIGDSIKGAFNDIFDSMTLSIENSFKEMTLKMQEEIPQQFSNIFTIISQKIDMVLGNNFQTFHESINLLINYINQNAGIIKNTFEISDKLLENIKILETSYINNKNRLEEELNLVLQITDSVKSFQANQQTTVAQISESISQILNSINSIKNTEEIFIVGINTITNDIKKGIDSIKDGTDAMKNKALLDVKNIQDFINSIQLEVNKNFGNIEISMKNFIDLMEENINNIQVKTNTKMEDIKTLMDNSLDIVSINQTHIQDLLEEVKKIQKK